MRLTLKSIICYYPTAESLDEPFLKIFVDDNPHYYWDTGRGMRRGWDIQINQTIDFNRRVKLQLYEKDRPSRNNDFIGEFEVDTSHERGAFDIDLGIQSPLEPMYNIWYEVTRDASDSLPRWNLKLDTLKCNDAQEATDEVRILLNNDSIWARDMRTDEIKEVGDFVITTPAKIELWEIDGYTNKSDFLGIFMLHITDSFDFENLQHYTFSQDRGISGNASYTLDYIVTELSYSSRFRGRHIPTDTLKGAYRRWRHRSD